MNYQSSSMNGTKIENKGGVFYINGSEVIFKDGKYFAKKKGFIHNFGLAFIFFVIGFAASNLFHLSISQI